MDIACMWMFLIAASQFNEFNAYVAGINKGQPLCFVIFKQSAHGVYRCFTTTFLPCTKLVSACTLLDVLRDNWQNGLANDPLTHFSHSDWSNTRALVESHETISYKGFHRVGVNWTTCKLSVIFCQSFTQLLRLSFELATHAVASKHKGPWFPFVLKAAVHMDEASTASNSTGWNGIVSFARLNRVEGSHGWAGGCFWSNTSQTVHIPCDVSKTSSRLSGSPVLASLPLSQRRVAARTFPSITSTENLHALLGVCPASRLIARKGGLEVPRVQNCVLTAIDVSNWPTYLWM